VNSVDNPRGTRTFNFSFWADQKPPISQILDRAEKQGLVRSSLTDPEVDKYPPTAKMDKGGGGWISGTEMVENPTYTSSLDLPDDRREELVTDWLRIVREVWQETGVEIWYEFRFQDEPPVQAAKFTEGISLESAVDYALQRNMYKIPKKGIR